MNPSLAVAVSGVSIVPLLTAGTALGAGLLLDEALLFSPVLQPLTINVPAAVAPAVKMNLRLEKLDMKSSFRECSRNENAADAGV
jgi:hypothetical protein